MRGGWLALGLMVVASGALAQDAAMPVVVGGNPEVNACGTQALSAGMTDVHVGPGDQYEVYDHLKDGESAFLCQRTKAWYGIVYGKSDCGVSKPIAEQKIYVGGCKTGWVSASSLTATSG